MAARCRFPVHPGYAEILAKLRKPSRIGILVEKANGQRVGRVPLGKHSKGNVKIRWNLKVGGTRLRHGRYKITLRALDAHGNVLGLTEPITVKV